MSFLFVFFAVFFVLSLVVAPWLRNEDRPAFKRPDKKPRRMI